MVNKNDALLINCTDMEGQALVPRIRGFLETPAFIGPEFLRDP